MSAPEPMTTEARLYGTCPKCRRKFRLRSDGLVRGHRDRSQPDQVCVGEYQPPIGEPTTDPWRPVPDLELAALRKPKRWAES